MVKEIRMKHVKSQLRNSFAKLRQFPGATLKHLSYFIVPSLFEETPWFLSSKIQLQKRLQMK